MVLQHLLSISDQKKVQKKTSNIQFFSETVIEKNHHQRSKNSAVAIMVVSCGLNR